MVSKVSQQQQHDDEYDLYEQDEYEYEQIQQLQLQPNHNSNDTDQFTNCDISPILLTTPTTIILNEPPRTEHENDTDNTILL